MIYRPIYFDGRDAAFKLCSCCHILKAVSEFSKNRRSKDGLKSQCKSCTSVYTRKRYNENRERLRAESRHYQQEHPKEAYLRHKEWKERNPERLREYEKIYEEENKERLEDYRREYYQKNKERVLVKSKIYRKKNAGAIRLQKMEYREKNKEKIALKKKRYGKTHGRVAIRRYWNNAYNNNIQFRLASCLRGRTRMAVKGGYKAGSAIRDLGCSIEFFKSYLEDRFYTHSVTNEEMNWENYGKGPGKWQLHHIKSLVSFDLEVREQFLVASHSTNMKPLWHVDHVKVHSSRSKKRRAA